MQILAEDLKHQQLGSISSTQSLLGIKVVAFADSSVAATDPRGFQKLIVDGGNKQMLNADGTALFWKIMPNKTCM